MLSIVKCRESHYVTVLDMYGERRNPVSPLLASFFFFSRQSVAWSFARPAKSSVEWRGKAFNFVINTRLFQ